VADPINPDQLYNQAETAGFLNCSTWTLQAHRKKNKGLTYVRCRPSRNSPGVSVT